MDITKSAKGAILVFVATFIGLGINYVFGIFVARLLGVGMYGEFTLALTIFNMLALFAVFGIDHAILKYIPEYSKVSKKNEILFISSAILISSVISIILSVLLFVLSSYFGADLFKSEKISYLLKLFSFGILGYSLSVIALSILQSKHNVIWRMFVRYLSEPVIRIMFAIFLIYIGLEVVGAVIGYIVAFWVSLVLSMVWVFRYYKNSYINTNIVFSRKEDFDGVIFSSKQLLSYSSPLILGMIFLNLASKSDFLLLGYVLTSHDVGLYAAAFQSAAILLIILQSIESIIAPHLSEALNVENKNQIQEIYALALRWMLLAGVPSFVIFVVMSEMILKLYGNEFINASVVFLVLLFGNFVNLATGSANYMLLMKGKTKLVMMNQIIYAVVLLLTNIILIKWLGMIGAAVSLTIANIVLNVTRILQVYNLMNVQPYEVYLIKILAAGMVMFVVNMIFIIIEIHNPLIRIVAMMLFYVAALLVLGLNKKDKEALISVISVIKLKL